MGRVSQLLFPPVETGASDPRLATSAGLSLIGTIAQGLVRFGSSVLIARLASKDVLGQFNLILALAVFLVLCWPQACGTAAARFVAMARGERNSELHAATARFTGRVALAGTLPLAVVGAVYVEVSIDARPDTAIWTAGLVVSLAAYNYVRGLRSGQNQFGTTAAWDVLSSALSLSLMVLVLVADAPSLLLVPLIVGYLVSAIPGWPRIPAGLSTERKNEILRYVSWGTVYAVAAGGLLQITTLIASAHASNHELGDLAAAVALATPISLLAVVIRVSAAPSVSRMYAARDMDGVRQRVDLVTRTLVVILTPLIAIGIIAAPWVLRVTFGSDFESGAVLLVLLLVGVAFGSCDPAHLRLSSTYAHGVRHSAVCNVVGLLLGVLITLVLSPTIGATAAGVGFLTGTALTSMLVTAIVWRMDAMKWAGLCTRFAVGCAVAVGCFLVVRDDDGPGRALIALILVTVGWVLLNLRDIKRIRLGR